MAVRSSDIGAVPHPPRARRPHNAQHVASARSAGTSRIARALLVVVILELTLVTAVIHFSVGSTLFLLNALGYVGLGLAYAVVAAAPIAMIQRLGWLPRLGLAAYAAVTIVAYVVIGPHFSLGWITKAVELAIVGLVAVDLLATYGGRADSVRAPSANL